jgi:molybdopterin converting factor small subunit
MKVHLRAFASLREHFPKEQHRRPGEAEFELPDEATLRDLFLALGLDKRLGSGIFDSAVDHTFQVMINHVAVNAYDHPLAEGDEIALFPPMAGG